MNINNQYILQSGGRDKGLWFFDCSSAEFYIVSSFYSDSFYFGFLFNIFPLSLCFFFFSPDSSCSHTDSHCFQVGLQTGICFFLINCYFMLLNTCSAPKLSIWNKGFSWEFGSENKDDIKSFANLISHK